MKSIALQRILTENGYTIASRNAAWTECVVSNAEERWQGTGVDLDEALDDVLRQMLPSALARRFAESHLAPAPAPPIVELPIVAPPIVEPPLFEPPLVEPSVDPPPAVLASQEPSDAPAPAAESPLVAVAITDRGLRRPHNEDAVLSAPDRGLFAVADGLGGRAGGEVASTLALDALQRALAEAHEGSTSKARYLALLEPALHEANRVVFAEGRRNPALRGMGATVAAALVAGRQIAIAHAGDCRVYRMRRGVLELLTTDHSLVNHRLREGEVADAKRSTVTRALGTVKAVEIDVAKLTSRAGDLLLLCTDGLHAVVPHAELSDVLSRDASPDAMVGALVAAAHTRGAPDNVSAVLVRWNA